MAWPSGSRANATPGEVLDRHGEFRHHTLLHDDTSTSDGAYPNWAMWLRAAGLEDVDASRGPRFDYPGLLLQAAAAGRGIALALSTIAAADLAAGRLVKPFALAVPTPFAYYVLCPQTTAERPKVAAFARCAEADRDRVVAAPARRARGITDRKPATLGETLTEEFMRPLGLTQGALAEAMGVQRKHVNELCTDRRNVTAAPALILARVFGSSPDFWLNVQRRGDLWQAMHSPRDREWIERTRPLTAAV